MPARVRGTSSSVAMAPSSASLAAWWSARSAAVAGALRGGFRALGGEQAGIGDTVAAQRREDGIAGLPVLAHWPS
jgi:hypothetical protein